MESVGHAGNRSFRRNLLGDTISEMVGVRKTMTCTDQIPREYVDKLIASTMTENSAATRNVDCNMTASNEHAGPTAKVATVAMNLTRWTSE